MSEDGIGFIEMNNYPKSLLTVAFLVGGKRRLTLLTSSPRRYTLREKRRTALARPGMQDMQPRLSQISSTERPIRADVRAAKRSSRKYLMYDFQISRYSGCHEAPG